MMDFYLYIGLLIFSFLFIQWKDGEISFSNIKQIFFSILYFFFLFVIIGFFFFFQLAEIFDIFSGYNVQIYNNWKLLFYTVSNTTSRCINFFMYDFLILNITEENIIAGFNYTTYLIPNFVYLYEWYYIPTMSNDLVISFLIACFITISIFFILILTRPYMIIISAIYYIFLLLIVSFIFIFSSFLPNMFLAFEALLLIALGLLKLTSKSERIGEAISEMFMWTLFGSFFLLLGFFTLYIEIGNNFEAYQHLDNLNIVDNFIIYFFFLIGFGVKIPLWPFISWLLKAHVEASVEFSILLSGFIVKLGLLGLWRILDLFNNEYLFFFLFVISILAILDAVLRLFSQIDLKRIVALTTVIEMNWINIIYLLGDSLSLYLANFLVIVHCFTTTSEFLLVECISKRYNSRDFWHITGLWYNTPILWYMSFIIIFVTIGFPGTSIFFIKFLFFSILLSYSWWLFIFFLLIFFLILPLYFIRLWVPIWFGLGATTTKTKTFVYIDLTSKEIFLLGFSSGINIILGIYPTLFFNLF